MRFRLVFMLLACAGCKRSPPPAPLFPLKEHSEQVAIAGCPFAVHLPAGTTGPLADDGLATAGLPRALHLSFVGDPRTSISLVWRTDDAATGTRIDYGTGTFTKHAQGFSFAYPSDHESALWVRIHEVHLCGLQPGTTYRYRIAGTIREGGNSGNSDNSGQEGDFSTAPEVGGRPLRFAVTGDSRDNPAEWGLVAQAIKDSSPEFLLYSGDAVSSGNSQAEWDAWFDAARAVLPSLPIETALGNHEANTPKYDFQFALPAPERWYSFDYGDVHVIVLDDTPPDPAMMEQQARFLKDDLATTKARWKVVMHHRAVYSSSVHGSQADLQALWMPLYDKYGVDVVFNGHDHDYERTHPMRGGAVVSPGQGTIYVVNGGAGAPLYPNGVSSFTAISRKSYGYSLVDVSGDSMTLDAFSVEGEAVNRIDHCVLTK